jgi:hypothetical protein
MKLPRRNFLHLAAARPQLSDAARKTLGADTALPPSGYIARAVDFQSGPLQCGTPGCCRKDRFIGSHPQANGTRCARRIRPA